MELDPEAIAGIGTAVGIALSAVIYATAKAIRGKRGDDTELHPDVRMGLVHISELRALTQDEAIERVHAAESRRVLLGATSTIEALVIGIDRDRDDRRADVRAAREERQRLLEAVQKLTEAIQRR